MVILFNITDPMELSNEQINTIELYFKSFGFETYSINGHEVSEIYSVLTNFKTDKPKAIIANTIKGKGVSFMENKKEWHQLCFLT